MSEELKALHESLNKVAAEFRSTIENSDKKSALVTEKLDKMNKRMDEIELEQKRVMVPVNKNEPTPEVKAFRKYLRVGKEGLTPDEAKALTVGDNTQAGYLAAPPEFLNELIRNLVQVSPVRQVARVITTTRSSVQIPKRTAGLTAAWVAEVGTKSEDTTYRAGLEEIPTHEMYALKDVSNMLLEDSAFNIEAELAADFGVDMARLEGVGFISGNAVGKPEGLTVNTTAIAADVHMGSTSAVSADKLIAALYDLAPEYARSATWLMNNSLLSAIRQLKNGTTTEYVWQPGLTEQQPASILGKPYVVCPDMPSIASAAEVIAVGDFKQAYYIVDRLDVQMLRDPFTQATTGKVRFVARRRVGGQVVLAEAYRLIVMSV